MTDRGIDALLGDEESDDAPSAKKLVRGIGVPGGIAILFVLLRILAVAHWDWNIASSIAATIDLQSIFQMGMGTLFARPGLTGLVVMILLPLVVLSILWPTPGESRWQLTPMLFATVLAAIAVSRVLTSRSWWLPIGVLVIAGGLAAVYHRWSSVLEHRAVVRAKRGLNVAILLSVLGLAAIVDTPWWEREELVVTATSVDEVLAPADDRKAATATLSGYVVEVEFGFVKVLTDDRELVILRTDQVVDRRILRPTSE